MNHTLDPKSLADGYHVCTVCGGFEDSLATHCPGRPLTRDERAALEAGHDFVDGRWETY